MLPPSPEAIAVLFVAPCLPAAITGGMPELSLPSNCSGQAVASRVSRASAALFRSPARAARTQSWQQSASCSLLASGWLTLMGLPLCWRRRRCTSGRTTQPSKGAADHKALCAAMRMAKRHRQLQVGAAASSQAVVQHFVQHVASRHREARRCVGAAVCAEEAAAVAAARRQKASQ